MQIDDLINTLEQTAAGLRTLRSLIGEQPGVTQVTTQLGLMLGHLTEPAAAAPPPPPSESRRPRRETKKAGAGTIDRNRETPESSGRGVNRLVTIDNGDPMTVAQAAEELGLKPGSVLVGLTPTVQRRTGGHMGGKNVRPYLGSSNGDGPLASGGNGRSSHESRPRFGDATTIPNNPNRVVRGGGGRPLRDLRRRRCAARPAKAFPRPPADPRIREHLPLVVRIASQLRHRLPPSVELEDLVQEGVFGLADAISKFDPDRGVKFSTYAGKRIYGALLDYLRELDPNPRLVRNRVGRLQRAAETFCVRRGRQPDPEELAHEVGLPQEQVAVLLKERWAETSSLSRVVYSDDGKEVREIHQREDKRVPNPAAVAEARELLKLILRGLPRWDRLILQLYYGQQMTMKEIGQAIGLSESRVSQLHKALMPRLKTRLENLSLNKESA